MEPEANPHSGADPDAWRRSIATRKHVDAEGRRPEFVIDPHKREEFGLRVRAEKRERRIRRWKKNCYAVLEFDWLETGGRVRYPKLRAAKAQ